MKNSTHPLLPEISARTTKTVQNMVRVIESKIIKKRSEGKQKFLRVSGRLELLRVRVTEGKITVNV